jgi:predicted RNA-binding protein YlxR (DUF448 family)
MKHEKILIHGTYQPIRMCAACRTHRIQSQLIRIGKTKDGSLKVDWNHSLGGRGVYLCKSIACIEKAQQIRGIERALKSAVPQEIYEECKKFEG